MNVLLMYCQYTVKVPDNEEGDGKDDKAGQEHGHTAVQHLQQLKGELVKL